ncbi:MAG: hypothetical protein ACOCRX_08145 [Candidatus Woesearchaeota archaeon]
MIGILKEILNILWQLISGIYTFLSLGVVLILILYILSGFWKAQNWDIQKEKKGIIKKIINIIGMIISIALFIGGIYLFFLAVNIHKNILYSAFDVFVLESEHGVYTYINKPYNLPILAYIYIWALQEFGSH